MYTTSTPISVLILVVRNNTYVVDHMGDRHYKVTVETFGYDDWRSGINAVNVLGFDPELSYYLFLI